jgi:hypothetical protein
VVAMVARELVRVVAHQLAQESVLEPALENAAILVQVHAIMDVLMLLMQTLIML